MVHLPHLGKLRREVKEEAVDADDAAGAGAGAEASPFHKRSRLAQQQQPPPQVGFPVPSSGRSTSDNRNYIFKASRSTNLHRNIRTGRSCTGRTPFFAWKQPSKRVEVNIV